MRERERERERKGEIGKAKGDDMGGWNGGVGKLSNFAQFEF